jgi:hypothetical protein
LFLQRAPPHHTLITKWRLNTKAIIRDGNLGRAEAVLKPGQDIVLEVFSKGTCATGWEEVVTVTTDEEGVRTDELPTTYLPFSFLFCSFFFLCNVLVFFFI